MSRDDRGSWHYRKSVQATRFWTVLLLAWFSIVVIDIGFRSGPNALFYVGWGVFAFLSIFVTAVSVIGIVRRESKLSRE